jgi:FAD:protein FMN transferase
MLLIETLKNFRVEPKREGGTTQSTERMMTIETDRIRRVVEGEPAASSGGSNPRGGWLASPTRHSEKHTATQRLLQAFAGPTLSPALDCDHDPSLLKQKRFAAMTTEVGLWLYSSYPSAQEELDSCQLWVKSLETRLSRFREYSELSRLNRSAGRGPIRVSNLLFELVRESLELADRLAGLFDPTVLPALVKAGYGTGLAEGRIDYREVRLDDRSRTITLPYDIALDLGGVAKGWMADKLTRYLGRFGSSLVDMGGDLRAWGPMAWPVALDDPWNPSQSVINFHLQNAGVATSSLLKRCWGRDSHHLIDPRTGRPAQTDLVAVSVKAPTATLAEGLAKAALIMGKNQARAFLQKEGFQGVLFGKEHSIS